MSITLEQNIPTLIIGPQGSGKSLLARKVAEKYGHYVEADVSQLCTEREADELLHARATVVIVDGLPRTQVQFTRVKALITAPFQLLSGRYGSEKRQVDTPHFIFCVIPGDDDRALSRFLERRCNVIRLDERGRVMRAAA